VHVFPVINGEKAAYCTPTFSEKRERTLGLLMKGLEEDYNHEVSETSPCHRFMSGFICLARTGHFLAHPAISFFLSSFVILFLL